MSSTSSRKSQSAAHRANHALMAQLEAFLGPVHNIGMPISAIEIAAVDVPSVESPLQIAKSDTVKEPRYCDSQIPIETSQTTVVHSLGMNESDAQLALQSGELVQVALAGMQDIKRMREQCLRADIPALMQRPEAGCGSG